MEESHASSSGWHKLVEGYPWFEGEGAYPLPAYSEFMPPPRLGITPTGELQPDLFSENDPYGWHISEIEEFYQLRPGTSILEKLLYRSWSRMPAGGWAGFFPASPSFICVVFVEGKIMGSQAMATLPVLNL